MGGRLRLESVATLVWNTQSKLLDKSLVYTAITRAQSRCHILGDYEAFKIAVMNPPKATARLVGLGVALAQSGISEVS
jgi:exodeoxyribonuclease V alpha subunit